MLHISCFVMIWCCIIHTELHCVLLGFSLDKHAGFSRALVRVFDDNIITIKNSENGNIYNNFCSCLKNGTVYITMELCIQKMQLTWQTGSPDHTVFLLTVINSIFFPKIQIHV